MEEFNRATPEVLNTLYKIAHPQKKKHKRISYKRGKHAYNNKPTQISKATFEYMLLEKPNMLVFGKAGIGKLTMVQEYMKEGSKWN